MKSSLKTKRKQAHIHIPDNIRIHKTSKQSVLRVRAIYTLFGSRLSFRRAA